MDKMEKQRVPNSIQWLIFQPKLTGDHKKSLTIWSYVVPSKDGCMWESNIRISQFLNEVWCDGSADPDVGAVLPFRGTWAAVCSCLSSVARVVAASWALQSSTSSSFKLLLSSWISLSLRHISRRRTTAPSSTSFVISATAAFANTSMMAATCGANEEGKDILPSHNKNSEEANDQALFDSWRFCSEAKHLPGSFILVYFREN